MTQKSCAVGMRNAKLGNHLNIISLGSFHYCKICFKLFKYWLWRDKVWKILWALLFAICIMTLDPAVWLLWSEQQHNRDLRSIYIITSKPMRAFWLVNQLCVIVPVNPRKNRASSKPVFSREMFTLVLFLLYWSEVFTRVNTVANLGKWRQDQK